MAEGIAVVFASRERSMRRRRETQRGQSLVELALVAPVLLLMVFTGIDFARVFLGWINLQTMVKNAANFAANNPAAWGSPGDVAVQSRYQALVLQDAAQINCSIPAAAPDPQFSGTGLGADVRVDITCLFGVITPAVSIVTGPQIPVTASAVFPVKSGGIGDVYGGGAPPVPPPAATMVVSPVDGNAPLAVAFTDASSNTPTSWTWNFGDGFFSSLRNPTHTYATAGAYVVHLTACNAGGCGTASPVTITANPAPVTGPVPNFTATPRTGPYPLSVQFTDASTGTITTRTWTFGDGATSTAPNPSHTYNSPGTYTVTLTVSDGTTSNTETRDAYVIAGNSPCVVPNFTGVLRNNAQGVWSAAGFTTQVQKQNGQGNYSIQYQSLTAFLQNPPNGCNAVITVGP